jgi:hypothetical protein
MGKSRIVFVGDIGRSLFTMSLFSGTRSELGKEKKTADVFRHRPLLFFVSPRKVIAEELAYKARARQSEFSGDRVVRLSRSKQELHRSCLEQMHIRNR